MVAHARARWSRQSQGSTTFLLVFARLAWLLVMAFYAWYTSQKGSFEGLSGPAVMKAAGEGWRRLTKEQKQEWKEKAAVEKSPSRPET